jgi:hypothetical protein
MCLAFHLKKVVLNVKLFIIKVEKCEQSSILLPYYTNCQNANEAKDGSGNK